MFLINYTKRSWQDKQAKLFGLDVEPAVLTSLDYVRAETVSIQVDEAIKPLCDRLKIVGSIRRKKPKVGNCNIVVLATDANWGRIVQTLENLKSSARTRA